MDRDTDLGRGGLVVCNFDSYVYACGFESGLGNCAYGTLGKPPYPVVLCTVSPMSRCVCLVLMSCTYTPYTRKLEIIVQKYVSVCACNLYFGLY